MIFSWIGNGLFNLDSDCYAQVLIIVFWWNGQRIELRDEILIQVSHQLLEYAMMITAKEFYPWYKIERGI